MQASTARLDTLQKYSGQKKNYAVLGIHRDVNRGASESIVRPFALTHSIYSFFLLNVEVCTPVRISLFLPSVIAHSSNIH